MTFDQAEYDLRCEWGLPGVRALAPASDAVVIVDVLSFSTAVDIAVTNGAAVLPYRWRDDSAADFAARRGALLASQTRADGYSLSPASLLGLPPGAALVLPSPNGATLALNAGAAGPSTFTACLRNAEAVSAAIRGRFARITLIPAGEEWVDGTLRPAIEDLIGAGAVLAHLPGRPSPEALIAVAAFEKFRHSLWDVIAPSGSGKELIERGFVRDVELACAWSSSCAVPLLSDDRFQNSPI